MSRLNILILLPRIPYPLRDGGAMAMHQTLEELIKQDCTVSVLAMNTARHYVEEGDLPPVYKQLKVFKTVYINNQIHPLSAFLNLFTDKSYNISRFEDKGFSAALATLLKDEKFDIILFESIYTSPYLEEVQEQTEAKCFCRVHNIEYLIWQRLAEHESNFLKRKYLQLLTERLQQYEIQKLKEFDLLLPISKQEESFFIEQKINASYCLPFGTSVSEPLEAIPEPNTLYHIGSMDWAPNLEAVEWFLNEVWIRLQKEMPTTKLFLAGKKMPKPIYAFQNEQTIVLGEIVDSAAFHASKEILIVPLLSGAGIRIKILEAMALGKCIIATTVAVEGIGVHDGVNIVLANDAEQFSQKIQYYINHKEEQLKIGQQARVFVQTFYQKEKIYSELIDGFKNLIG